MTDRPNVRIEPSADVAEDAQIGEGTTIWHLAQVREGAQLGKHCVVGRGAYIGTGVSLGENCKVQNYALVYEPAVLEDGVFIGPAVVLTNDTYPRAINPDGTQKSATDWEPVGVTVKTGASIGARAVCVAPVVIGAWSMIAAGAVVNRDVPDFALMVGVPARQIGWVGKTGHRLRPQSDAPSATQTGEQPGPQLHEHPGPQDWAQPEPLNAAPTAHRTTLQQVHEWLCPDTGDLFTEIDGILQPELTTPNPNA